MEKDATSIEFIRKAAKDLGIDGKLHIIRGDVFKFIKTNTSQFDFIFADPPYALANMDDLPLLVFEKKMLLPDGIFVLEHAPRNDYRQHPAFSKDEELRYHSFYFFHPTK